MRLAVAVAVVICGAAPSGAAAAEPWLFHTTLEASSPSSGEILAVHPDEVRLVFGGPVEGTGAMVRLLGSGDRVWTLEARRAPGDVRTVTAALPPIGFGSFRVEWRVISADGHGIWGDFVFYVGEDGASLEAPQPSGNLASGDQEARQFRAVDAPLPMVAVRVGADLALLCLAGLLLLSSWSRHSGTKTTLAATKGLAIIGALLAAAYGWMWAGEVLGSGAGYEAKLAGLVSLTSGRGLTAEIGLAIMAAWALLVAQRPGIASAFALMSVAAGGWAGHPAAYAPAIAVPTAALHLLAAALWLGGLLFIITERGAASYPGSIHRVSTLAMASAILIAVTGVVETWLLLGSVPSPTGPIYERMLLLKGAGFLALIAFGAHHRLRLLPLIDEGQSPDRLFVSVRRELVLAACVVALAAVLSHIPPTP